MQIIRLDERITRFVDDINNARNASRQLVFIDKWDVQRA